MQRLGNVVWVIFASSQGILHLFQDCHRSTLGPNTGSQRFGDCVTRRFYTQARPKKKERNKDSGIDFSRANSVYLASVLGCLGLSWATSSLYRAASGELCVPEPAVAKFKEYLIKFNDILNNFRPFQAMLNHFKAIRGSFRQL